MLPHVYSRQEKFILATCMGWVPWGALPCMPCWTWWASRGSHMAVSRVSWATACCPWSSCPLVLLSSHCSKYQPMATAILWRAVSQLAGVVQSILWMVTWQIFASETRKPIFFCMYRWKQTQLDCVWEGLYTFLLIRVFNSTAFHLDWECCWFFQQPQLWFLFCRANSGQTQVSILKATAELWLDIAGCPVFLFCS